ncbi:MAG: glycosidase [Cyclobacteriaceae bacterium]|jgi:sucrose phosphorylase
MTKQQLIQSVYGKSDSEKILSEIEELQKKYLQNLHQSSKKLSQKDVLLITYGDQVIGEEHSKLSSLRAFLGKWAKEQISMVHILPFYPYSSDDGFSVIDYYEVDPELGSWEDVASFSEDFDLMFDGVINHISQKSMWLEKYLNNDPDFKDYFVEVDPNQDFSLVTRPRTLPLVHSFVDVGGNERFLWTTFSKDQVDLNFANPKVLINILDLLLFYIQNGARAIRLDAIGFMWKELGTTCIHLNQTHQLIQLMRQVIEELAPSTLLITETNVPHIENISYYGNGYNEAHLVYNFTLPPLLAYSILAGDTMKLITWAQSLALPSTQVCFFNFLASHDGVGVRPVAGILSADEIGVLTDAVVSNGGRVSYKSNIDGTQSPYELNCNYLSLLHGVERDQELAIKRMVLAHGIVLAMPGLPAIYFHSFFGSQNDIGGVEKSGINRRINREKLPFDLLEKELNLIGSTRNRVYSQLCELIDLRKKQSVFDPYADFSFPETVNGVFAIERGNDTDAVICLFNLTNASIEMPDFIDLVDLIAHSKFDGSLNAYEMVWLRK